MTRHHTVLDSPLGPLTVVVDDEGLCGLYVEQGLRKALERSATLGSPSGPEEVPLLQAVAEQLTAYFRGELTEFDLPVSAAGTPFQQRVWAALCRIPYGETRSYGALAAEIGNPAASRAVGAANGRNPLSIVVPCHRVIGSTGRLTGYAGGLTTKEQLLAHERSSGAGPSRRTADSVVPLVG
jgi:methylated-DNA-[protein]-cysteine S-methyltransferase